MIATRKNDHRLMQVLVGPVISEKATMVADKNEQVVFPSDARCKQIRNQSCC